MSRINTCLYVTNSPPLLLRFIQREGEEVLAERRTLTDAHFSSITKEKRALQLARTVSRPDVPSHTHPLLLAPDSKAVTPKGVLLASKELQVVSAPVTLPVVYQMMLQHVRSSADIPLLQRACGGLQEPLVSYLQRCTKICWFLQTHEPPIMLDFTGSKPEHYATYMEQTYTGDLDYVVWPVVRSQEGSVGYLLQGSAKFHNFKTTESPARRRPVPPPPSPQPTSVPWDEYRKEGLYYFTTDT
ncbi:hypothetical protein DPMN_108376 [Dreissena polymorpha]|uniref:Mitochondria-eating protein n=1 Tax=Dreissena polymorpha TaxID=45954 RepID=A0A9D4K8P0_DREPO|nr:hypothetical protein DPMN_108376 [Dreissena polymorpha]